jgi:glycosyltransferase involved in cell wall biosynthesis
MKILHVIAPCPAGGAESAVRSLAIGLRNAGHDVEVAALTADTVGEHPFVRRLRSDDIPVTELRFGRRDYLGETRALAALLMQRKHDIVHSHVYRADTVTFLASTETATPHVSTLHGFTGGGLRQAAYVKFDSWILRRCAAVICVAPNVRDEALATGLNESRLHLVPNGYEPGPQLSREAARAVLNLAPDAQAVGWIGRLSREKGPDQLLDGIASMHQYCAVTMIGDGPERVNLDLQATRLRLTGRVRFPGQVDDAGRFLPAFDVLALSSRTEGTPMVLLEAMASRVPIVTYNVGGVSSMLTTDSALIVAPGDFRGLARALDYTFACPRTAALRANVAHRAFESNYSASRCAQRTIDIYSDVLTRAPFGSRVVAPLARRSQPQRQSASTYRQAGM